MLLQTNSYIVPREKRAAHGHLMQRFRQTLMKIGCDHFEVYEQVGANWAGAETSGRFVQMMRFRDRKHCQAVQLAERNDAAAQALVREFMELINFPYQEQEGLFAHGYYAAVIEPIKTRPNALAYHAFDGKEDPFDPDAFAQDMASQPVERPADAKSDAPAEQNDVANNGSGDTANDDASENANDATDDAGDDRRRVEAETRI